MSKFDVFVDNKIYCAQIKSVEYIVGKGENTSIFSISHNVFNRPIFVGC